MDSIIDVNQLSVHFPLANSIVRAVDGIDLTVMARETLAIIGESGSGKSVLGLALLGMLPPNCTVSGQIHYEGSDLLALTDEELQAIRGIKIAWVPQNPSNALNPSMRVGEQIGEPLTRHMEWTRDKIHEKVLDLLLKFRVLPPEERSRAYPHSYSGGMLQRALVAMGVSAHPVVIIADEPTKGIDVLNKESISAVFKKVREQGITLIVITHDLAFAEDLADRVIVLYNGRIIEIGERNSFFSNPLHPYSVGLLRSLPENGLHPIPGRTCDPNGCITGCKFRMRCFDAQDRCTEEPPLIRCNGGNTVRCWKYD
jgi:peptide/nickel transport system ATP-binding protein